MLSSISSAARSAASWSSSIAPSTACSASLLQGAARPTYESAIEKLSCDTDVIPGRLLPVGVAQQRSRMVRHHEGDPVVAVDLVAELAQTLLHAEERLGRRAPEGEYHPRTNDGELPPEVRDARRDFVGQRLAVPGGAALH